MSFVNLSMASNNIRFEDDGTKDETMEDNTIIPATIGGRDGIITAMLTP